MQTQIDKSKFNSIAESATMKIKFHFDCHVNAFSKRHANIPHPCCIINKNFFSRNFIEKVYTCHVEWTVRYTMLFRCYNLRGMELKIQELENGKIVKSCFRFRTRHLSLN